MRLSHRVRSGLAVGGAALGLFLSQQQVVAEDPHSIVRVEENWVLVLNTPDDSVDSPQFHTIMSPYSHT